MEEGEALKLCKWLGGKEIEFPIEINPFILQGDLIGLRVY